MAFRAKVRCFRWNDLATSPPGTKNRHVAVDGPDVQPVASVPLFDYRGYGGSDGHPTEAGLAADARAARAYLASRGDVDPNRLVYFGESLGAAVALGLAVEHPPAARWYCARRSHRWPTSDACTTRGCPCVWLLRDRYPSLERIAHVTCPLLVIAGDRDSVVPVDQSRQLYAAATGPKRLVIIGGADHNDEALVAGPEIIQSTRQLLQAF